jgi:hypothetical protein
LLLLLRRASVFMAFIERRKLARCKTLRI